MDKKTKKNKFADGSTKYALLSVLGIAGFFVIWQLLVVSGIINSKYLAAPTDIIKLFFVKIAETAPDGNTLQVNVFSSLRVSLLGLFTALILGIPLGWLMGWYRWVDRFVTPLFEIIRPIPPISWIPLTILWLGIGLKAQAFIIFFSAFIPCVINSYTGIKQTSPVLINVAKTFGATNFTIFIKVGIPSSLPITFAGIRVALGNSWSTLVAAEMLASSAGLGYMILMGRAFARPDIIVLGMLVIGVIGAIMTALLEFAEKKIVKWGGRTR
ncbi:ABC transporter permease [Lactonifactor longoviformis]|uniref:NitT/TauT family transport system permease protein n=2 Tax=Lactonifactor TaxID=420345 RepID=A0A1M5BA98_9CLOT|nr:NitT/TauT family transport system permease protein [Lactonifactor longoviformis DSM 17459]